MSVGYCEKLCGAGDARGRILDTYRLDEVIWVWGRTQGGIISGRLLQGGTNGYYVELNIYIYVMNQRSVVSVSPLCEITANISQNW